MLHTITENLKGFLCVFQKDDKGKNGFLDETKQMWYNVNCGVIPLTKRDFSFVNILLPFICVLIIPFFLWNLSNFYVVNQNNNKALSVTMEAMKNYINHAERDLTQIETMVYSIAQNPAFSSFFYDGRSNVSYNEMKSLQITLATYDIRSLPICQMYIYNRISDVLIVHDTLYRTSADFYRTKLSPADLDLDTWHTKMLGGNWPNGYSAAAQYTYEDKPMNLIQYRQGLPFARKQNVNANVTVLIDAEKLFEAFDSLYAAGGAVCIYNDENICMYTSSDAYSSVATDTASANPIMRSEEVKINGKKLCRLLYKSEESGWCYSIYVPQNYIFTDSHKINTILIITAIFAFMIACLISIYFTYGRSKVLLSIKEMLGIQEEPPAKHFDIKSNEMVFCQTHLQKLMNENKSVRVELTEAQEMNWDSTLHLLFFKRFHDEEAAQKALAKSRITFTGNRFMVFCVYTPGGEQISLKKQLIEMLQERFGETAYVHQVDTQCIAVLFSFNESPDVFKAWFEKEFQSNMQSFYKSSLIYFGTGSSTEKVSQIYLSYEQSKQVAEFNCLVGRKEIMFFEDLPAGDRAYSYSIEEETRLVNYVRDANFTEAKEMLQKLYDKNLADSPLHPKEIRRLLDNLYATMMHIQDSFKKVRFTCPLDSGITAAEFFKVAEIFLEQACMEAYEDREGFTKYQTYLKENYQNQDLSLQMLAEHFNVQTSFVSKLFKKHTGMNFFAYLEQMRMEKASELLQNESMPIKDIALAVGYASDLSFRRAFKKCKGVNPSAYKKLS